MAEGAPVETLSPARQRNQRGEGANLRAEVIQAAMRILDRAPATELSLRMVAREAGVAAPSLYAHFPDARAMMAEIVRECWRQLGEEMSRAPPPAQQQDALADLQARIGAYVRYAMERPSRYQLLFAVQPFDAERGRELPGPVQPVYRSVLDCISRMGAEGFALPGPNLAAATLLPISIAHGRIALAHTAPHRPGNAPAAVEAYVGDMIRWTFDPMRTRQAGLADEEPLS